MKKQALIEQLLKAARGEEMATRAYISHLKAITARFEVPPAQLRAAREMMEVMIRHDQSHRVICEQLLEYAREQDRDDF